MRRAAWGVRDERERLIRETNGATALPAAAAAASAEEELARGERFAFGENWRRFLESLDEDRIAEAERSLKEMLGTESLEGRSFLDVGCGSGLFSLAARRLGAKVHSFDFDPSSVACARELRRRYFPDDEHWTVGQGSALDADFLASLETHDVVYSWGVLHHTGDQWAAIDLVSRQVKPGGLLYIALYNDQGFKSRVWTQIKRLYCRSPRPMKAVLAFAVGAHQWGPRIAFDFLRLKPFHLWRTYRQKRGMSPWRDVVDWVGGYPFEVSKPEEVLDFLRPRGFELKAMTTVGGKLGCNQFVFFRAGRSSVEQGGEPRKG